VLRILSCPELKATLRLAALENFPIEYAEKARL
jgi:hypothetical protein